MDLPSGEIATDDGMAGVFGANRLSSRFSGTVNRITCSGCDGGVGLSVHAAVPATAAPKVTPKAVYTARARHHEPAGRATRTATLAETERPESVSRLRRARSARSSAAL